jgi:hypothetical protein
LGDARDRFVERTGPRSFSSSRLLSPLRGDASGFLSDAPAPRTKSRLVTTDFINAGQTPHVHVVAFVLQFLISQLVYQVSGPSLRRT